MTMTLVGPSDWFQFFKVAIDFWRSTIQKNSLAPKFSCHSMEAETVDHFWHHTRCSQLLPAHRKIIEIDSNASVSEGCEV